MTFSSELVIAGYEAETAQQVIDALCTLMKAQGMVEEGYCAAVIEREKTYPTGIPTAFYDVAIPHAPSDHVLSPGIAIAQLKNGVPFYSMGDTDQKLDASVIFLLAVKNPKAQLNMLKSLMGIFENEDAMTAIKNAVSAAEIAEIIIDLGLMDEGDA